MKKAKDFILNLVKGPLAKEALTNLVKFLIRKVISSARFGGIKGWLLSIFVREILIERALEPAIEKIFREIGYYINKKNGEVLIKKLEGAESEGNIEEYDDVVDDIMR